MTAHLIVKTTQHLSTVPSITSIVLASKEQTNSDCSFYTQRTTTNKLKANLLIYDTYDDDILLFVIMIIIRKSRQAELVRYIVVKHRSTSKMKNSKIHYQLLPKML